MKDDQLKGNWDYGYISSRIVWHCNLNKKRKQSFSTIKKFIIYGSAGDLRFYCAIVCDITFFFGVWYGITGKIANLSLTDTWLSVLFSSIYRTSHGYLKSQINATPIWTLTNHNLLFCSIHKNWTKLMYQSRSIMKFGWKLCRVPFANKIWNLLA